MKQKIIVKVQMNCDKCRTKAMKIAAVEEGVISVAIEGAEKDRVVVIGDGVDSASLTCCLRKKLGYATLVAWKK
ncbi:Heavy metal-associated isoprenylated plant protein 47 [Vitis vinifera]|uniref:Heavy metal-associated isoprenylated plant protein 47 n=1 Tax=Vitis vinifera TaxID=29760 RepID=A0A438ER19_VITVI|nr:Heavy metal-associated isoprenylated plant protein 47 [Vitis vinifera]